MSDATGIPSVEIVPKRRSRLADFFIRLVREKPLGTISGIIILILIFVAIFADILAPYGYSERHLADRLTGPSARYLLGTDHLGRDLLSRLIVGARLSLLGRGLPQIILVLGISGGIGSSRVVRGAVISVKEKVYFQAADAIGSSKWRTLIRHVLPNIAAPIIIGVPSWGGMLSREGRQFMEMAPYLAKLAYDRG